MRSKSARAAFLAAVAVASSPLLSFGQTSGSWVVNADGNWGTASNWNTAMPDSGGVATFNQLVNQNATRNVTLDLPITLSALVNNSGPRWIIPLTGTNTLTLQGAGSAAGQLTSNF